MAKATYSIDDSWEPVAFDLSLIRPSCLAHPRSLQSLPLSEMRDSCDSYFCETAREPRQARSLDSECICVSKALRLCGKISAMYMYGCHKEMKEMLDELEVPSDLCPTAPLFCRYGGAAARLK